MFKKTTMIILILVIITCIFNLARKRTPVKYADIIIKNARHFDLEPELVFAVVKTESGFDTKALSRSQAKGLMQIMDKTGAWAAKELAISNFESNLLFDPEINIYIGSWYLSKLIDQYEGDLDLALAAYNAGSGNVYKWRNNKEYSKDGINLDHIPFGETRKYIKRVNRNLKLYKYLYWDVDTYEH